MVLLGLMGRIIVKGPGNSFLANASAFSVHSTHIDEALIEGKSAETG